MRRALDTLAAVHARVGAPQVLCLQEIRPDDAPLIQRLTGALPGYDCHFSLNRDQRNATLIPYSLFLALQVLRCGLGFPVF